MDRPCNKLGKQISAVQLIGVDKAHQKYKIGEVKMQVPSMYFLDASRYDLPTITRATLDDSRITLLLSDGAAEFLRYPASDAERTARVEFFKSLRLSEKFYGDIISLKLSLVSLDSALVARRMAQTTAVKCFKNVKVLKSFITCVDKITSLECESEIVKNAQNFWGREQREFIEKMRRDVEKAEEAIDSIGYVNMRLDNTGFSLIKDNNEDNFVDRLARICSELKVEIPRSSRLTLKLDIATADALERLYEDVFKYLRSLLEEYSELPVKELYKNKREIDFYLEINELVKRAEKSGIPFCYPENSGIKSFVARDAYDISLLHKKTESIVPNDITFEGDCGFCFLTGANGGGKTTYLRTVAINLILSLCGCPFADPQGCIPLTELSLIFPWMKDSEIREDLWRSREGSVRCLRGQVRTASFCSTKPFRARMT